jgi:AAA domain
MTVAELAQAMPDVARHFWGEPNPRHSSKKELRWGTNGARSVDVAKGSWFDHEAGEGGGVLDFLNRERVDNPWEWLREHGYGNASNGRANSQHKIIASYDYTDEFGALLFQVVRLAPKTFRQRRPDGKGGWLWNLEGVTRVLYRLPDLAEAIASERRVFVVEGEKDVETLARLGIVATCNPGGAGKWRDAYADQLVGADVVVLPDHDKAGRDHAHAVARSLAGKAARIRLLALPGLTDKGDASDWFAAGGTAEGFNALVDQAPDWTDNGTQASDETPQHNGRILRGTEFADLSTSSKKVWLVHHLLAIGEISVWYGEPGSGKSVGIEDLGLYVAVGRAWHGRQVKQCAVLYVALERANVVQRRAIAWGLEHDLSREQLPFKVIRGPLDFRDPQVAADIVATLEDLARRHGCEVGLIIVDTVSRALCGGDENSPKDMGALIANISRIQSAIGVHIALTHHQPVDGKERMRGHGALLGAVDTTIHVVNKDGTRLAEVVKSSDHEEGQRIAFFLKSVIIDQDDGYGDPVTAPVVIEDQAPTTAKAAKRAVKIPKNATLALNALRDAVTDCGQRAANAHIPASVQVVTLDQWRDYAWRRGLGGEEADSRQKAFIRAKECLAGSSLVGIWEPYAWPV